MVKAQGLGGYCSRCQFPVLAILLRVIGRSNGCKLFWVGVKSRISGLGFRV
jgi:hypothetical protein